MIDPWIQQVVDDFWAAAGELEPFPRSLEHPVLWALPLAIVKLPRLWIRDVTEWLSQRDISIHLDTQDRPLHGCTIAYAGKGLILLNGTDPEDEHRFSLAHETAHFLADYMWPRQYAIHRLGDSISEVLDGLRSPTVDERVHAILRSTSIGVHAHLMDRRPDGTLGCRRVVEAESRADRLALELLAPIAEVWRHVARSAKPSSFREGVTRTVCVLVSNFGLPRSVAESYGRALYSYWYGGPSVREWLGL